MPNLLALIKNPKPFIRRIIEDAYIRGNSEVVGQEIYKAIEAYDVELAQTLLDKQSAIWGVNDLAIMRAQSYIDLI